MDHDNLQEMIRLVDTTTKNCIDILREKNFVSSKEIMTYKTMPDTNEILKSIGLYAASSLDKYKIPFILYRVDIPKEAIHHTMAHECVHIAQMLKGDYVPLDETSVWKGMEVDNLPDHHPDYLEQPWEAEALMWGEIVMEEMIKRDSSVTKHVESNFDHDN